MPEPTTAPSEPAPQPASSGTEPGQTQVPEGFTLVRADELASTQRLASQARGMQQLVNPLIQAGIKEPGDLSALLESHQTLGRLREANVDTTQLLQSLSSPPQRSEPQPSGSPQLPEGVVTLDVLDQRLAHARATGMHETAWERQQSRINELASQITPQGATDFQKRMIRAGIEDLVLERSAFYPEGHPLHGDNDNGIQPIGDDAWSEITGVVKTGLQPASTEQPQANGSTNPAATIGAEGGHGPGASTTDKPVPFPLRPRAEKLALAQQMVEANQAAAGGQPVSTLGI